MAAATALNPVDEDGVVEAVKTALAARWRLDIRGGGSKALVGAPTPDAVALDVSQLSGVVDYDPAELVLTVRPGTKLSDVEPLLASRGQMLAFEPFDHGPIFGRPAGAATVGGVVAAGASGSRRLSRGGARDHLLGFRAVSGRAERLVGGAKVVKNVTGYDLPKLVAGSWGRVVVLTELSLKVVPRGLEQATMTVEGLGPREACALMARAMGSQADVAAAAHVPADGRDPASTVLRLEGFGPSVAARCAVLARLGASLMPPDEAAAAWERVRTLSPLGGEAPLWRVNVAPSAGPAVVEALEPLGARWLFDWAGGLVWLTVDADPQTVRRAAAAAGGHAALLRGPAALRQTASVFHPASPGVQALEKRVRQAFDPEGLFETGRFLGAA